MTEFESFYAYVQPSAPGASGPMLDRAIRDAAIEFAHRSQMFKATLDPISVTADDNEYDIDTPIDTLVSKVLKAWFNGSELGVTNVEDEVTPIAVNQSYDGASVVTGTPSKLIYRGGNSFLTLPTPSASVASAITIQATLKPTRSCQQLADEFDRMYEDHPEAIGAGALSRLLMIRTMPFFDPAIAAVHKGEFNLACHNARVRAQTGDIGRKPMRVRIPRI